MNQHNTNEAGPTLSTTHIAEVVKHERFSWADFYVGGKAALKVDLPLQILLRECGGRGSLTS